MMRAVCWYGRGDVRVESVPEPRLCNPRDAIIEITLTAICGSDIHLYDGYIPTMHKGDILGHEFMGRGRRGGQRRGEPAARGSRGRAFYHCLWPLLLLSAELVVAV